MGRAGGKGSSQAVAAARLGAPVSCASSGAMPSGRVPQLERAGRVYLVAMFAAYVVALVLIARAYNA